MEKEQGAGKPKPSELVLHSSPISILFTLLFYRGPRFTAQGMVVMEAHRLQASPCLPVLGSAAPSALHRALSSMNPLAIGSYFGYLIPKQKKIIPILKIWELN